MTTPPEEPQYPQYHQYPPPPVPPLYAQQPYAQQPYPPVPPPYGQPGYPPQFGYPVYGYPPAPLSAPAKVFGWILLGLGLLTVISAFLPWASVFGFSVNGIGGGDVGGAKDGVITLPLGLVVCGLGLGRALARRPGGGQLAIAIIALLLGGLIVLIAAVDTVDLSDTGASVGAGLVLTLIAGLGIGGAAIGAIVKRT